MSWMRRARRSVKGTGGFSVIEVLVAVAVFAFAIMAMATSTNLISKQMNIARRDMRLAFAMQQTMEYWVSQGWTGLTAGTYYDTVAGFPTTTTVSGTNPKTIQLVAEYEASSGWYADTIITQVARPDQ
jgi:type II secretory pathway pseudopilin PulG